MISYNLILPLLAALSGNPSTDVDSTKYIVGTIKAEKYDGRFFSPNIYEFSVENDSVCCKFFEVWGYEARKVDALLDKGDKVKIKIPQSQKNKKNNFSIDLEDIVEINNKPFKK